MSSKFIFSFLLIILLVLTACSQGPAEYDDFAKCLTEKGATIYGTDWCTHCKSQKAMFGKSFEYVYYVDCDKSREECLTAGVTGYPTWIINGESYPGEQNLFKLASLTGCELNIE